MTWTLAILELSRESDNEAGDNLVWDFANMVVAELLTAGVDTAEGVDMGDFEYFSDNSDVSSEFEYEREVYTGRLSCVELPVTQTTKILIKSINFLLLKYFI